MLPLWNGEGLASPKFGNIAIEKLIGKMLQTGSEKRNLIAKIFGGAGVLQDMIQFNIGLRNIEIAKKMLSEASIPIVASNIGGNSGRKIIFNTATGEVLLQLLGNNKESTGN